MALMWKRWEASDFVTENEGFLLVKGPEFQNDEDTLLKQQCFGNLKKMI